MDKIHSVQEDPHTSPIQNVHKKLSYAKIILSVHPAHGQGVFW